MIRNYAQVASDEAINNAKMKLEEHGFKVEVVDTLAIARDRVLELIPEGADVFTATSVTLTAAGLDEVLNDSSRYRPIRQRFTETEDDLERRRLGSASDYAIGSVHAVTEDGEVFLASNSGSQLPNYVYGANHFIWLVGGQKVVKDMAEAMDRIETYTLPLEDERAKQAYRSGSQISKLLIYRREPRGRGTIIIFKESVGY